MASETKGKLRLGVVSRWLGTTVIDDIIGRGVSAIRVAYNDISGESSHHFKTFYSRKLRITFLIPASIIKPRTNEFQRRLRPISLFFRCMQIIEEDN